MFLSYFRLRSACLIILVFFLISLSSCGGDESQKPNSITSEEKVAIPESEADKSYAKGGEIFKTTCQACHQANGQGLAKAFPPLAKSDYLLVDKKRAITQVLKGSSGEIIVNGLKYNSTMPPQLLNDEQVADVLNYVLHSWGNNGEMVTVAEVKAQRGI